MTPKSFDIDTCKQVVGDSRMRGIETNARQDADNGVTQKFDIDKYHKETYWGQVGLVMEYVIYTTTHKKRVERIARMKEKEAMR